jgi:hypothetical protein
MDKCRSCGAARSPDLEWCGQCYARYDTPAQRPTPQTVRMVIQSRGGSDTQPGLSFPLWMRAIITLGVLGGGVVLIEGFRPWLELGRPAWAIGAILLTVYASVGAVLAARMWSPDTFTRREEHIVVLDRRAMADAEKRQLSLIQHDDGDVPTATQRTF